VKNPLKFFNDETEEAVDWDNIKENSEENSEEWAFEDDLEVDSGHGTMIECTESGVSEPKIPQLTLDSIRTPKCSLLFTGFARTQ